MFLFDNVLDEWYFQASARTFTHPTMRSIFYIFCFVIFVLIATGIISLVAILYIIAIAFIVLWELSAKLLPKKQVEEEYIIFPDLISRLQDIPKNKNYPEHAVQCDGCGGYGCTICEDNGWLPEGHHRARHCANENCLRSIPPHQVAVYCKNECAFKDA